MAETNIKKNANGYGYLGLYKSPTYASWNAMKQRCDNPNAPEYELYGGRGVTYPDEWKTFKGFVDDMGVRPNGTSLDRINPFGNYSKDNCRWATKLEQQHNLRCQKRQDAGVYWSKQRKCWQAKIYFNNKQYGKRFIDKDEAITWRENKLAKLWEEYNNGNYEFN